MWCGLKLRGTACGKYQKQRQEVFHGYSKGVALGAHNHIAVSLFRTEKQRLVVFRLAPD